MWINANFTRVYHGSLNIWIPCIYLNQQAMLQAASNLNLPQPILIRSAKLQSIYFNLLLENYETIYLPVGMMVWQLFLLILLPIAIGMWLRHQIPGWVNKWAARFRQLTILALVLLILFITVVHANNLLFHIRELVLTALLYTLAAMAIGWVIGHSLKLGADDKFSLIVEFTVRNLALATVVGATVLENTELLTFTAAVFIIQVPLLLVSIYLQREQDLKRLPSK